MFTDKGMAPLKKGKIFLRKAKGGGLASRAFNRWSVPIGEGMIEGENPHWRKKKIGFLLQSLGREPSLRRKTSIAVSTSNRKLQEQVLGRFISIQTKKDLALREGN